ncbi:tRNA (N6-threonylcarbamoyladenosine(37)-N6)-methyltransferase TrmO [Aliagarivorans marinus]|uniref:tRNA (N6-threonylcarbamoyladenosine(37)-N6)-methyltransferase TrmO n=1 Tax=Aliagarivorans marinus TaxID=561965 RepID=UPI0006881AE3|nr:tRNA (N6-threonylcarbamoyladenosine(37)-N6)-methyltransferase TrmO [Aliagarivorans marinus]
MLSETISTASLTAAPRLQFIGQIHTPYQAIAACPNNIDPAGPPCTIEVFDAFQAGLSGLEVGQHILILYWLGSAERDANTLAQTTSENAEKGCFALRSPHRPNPIGAAVLKTEQLSQGRLTVRGLDCLDNTPLVDIKPAIYREVG